MERTPLTFVCVLTIERWRANRAPRVVSLDCFAASHPAVSSSTENFVQNGGFESPQVQSNTVIDTSWGEWRKWAGGSNSNHPMIVTSADDARGRGFAIYEGTQQLLGQQCGQDKYGAEQDIEGLMTGKVYVLSFAASGFYTSNNGRNGGNIGFASVLGESTTWASLRFVTTGLSSGDTAPSAPNWDRFELEFAAQSVSATIRLTDNTAAVIDCINFDDVSVRLKGGVSSLLL